MKEKQSIFSVQLYPETRELLKKQKDDSGLTWDKYLRKLVEESET